MPCLELPSRVTRVSFNLLLLFPLLVADTVPQRSQRATPTRTLPRVSPPPKTQPLTRSTKRSTTYVPLFFLLLPCWIVLLLTRPLCRPSRTSTPTSRHSLLRTPAYSFSQEPKGYYLRQEMIATADGYWHSGN